MPSPLAAETCPCGSSQPYAACCAPLHRGARPAATAEQLMRSRYAAYAAGDLGYVFRTWHPRTRPDEVVPSPGLTWTGLEVNGTQDGGEDDETGVVAFTASWRTDDGRTGQMVETSRFARRAGRWLYLDGDVEPGE